MTDVPVIDVQGLVKSFGALQVLNGITFQVEGGEVVAIIGPSGSGKTTVLRCLSGLEAGDAGTIRVAGHTIDCAVPLARQQTEVRALRLKAGFVFQNFNLFPHKTALENVIEGLLIVRRVPKTEAQTKGLALLEKVGLSAHANMYPSQLSGGQQQRTAIARALSMSSSSTSRLRRLIRSLSARSSPSCVNSRRSGAPWWS
jgi:cystine transport system ATP-binding protein